MSNPFNNSTLLKVGDMAPDFTLQNQNSQAVHLSDVLKKGWAILFFYPKDNSPICTSQVCAFRNAYDDFRFAGAEVIGISADSVESHQGFVSKQSLPFPLLSDPDRAVAQQYGIPMMFGLLPSRVTFVVDPNQIIRMVYPSQFTAKAHMEKALKLLRQRPPIVPAGS
jgi:peroxiredoxin Q/BCP